MDSSSNSKDLFMRESLPSQIAVAIGIIFSLLAATNAANGQGNSERPETSLARAIELEKNKDYAGAEKGYRQVLSAAADDPDILKRLGFVCQRQGKHEEAIEFLEKILARAPVYPGVNSLLAASYYALNQFEKTIEASEKELTGNPRDRQARYFLSLALSALGRLFEAIQHLETLRSNDPKDLPVLYQLAVDYKAAAQQANQRLATAAPDSEFTLAMRAEVLADTDRFDDAVAAFREVLNKNPDFPGIHLALGQLYWRRKDLEKSRLELKLALAEDPNSPLANYYLGDILVTDKEYLKAIPHLERTLSSYPELTRAYWLLGKCLGNSGNQQRAIEVFKRALELDPRYKEVHFQLHELYARIGSKAESLQHLQTFERLTREDQNRDREIFQQNQDKR
jgi:tetratricopeptide (TPR) repeat protein